jgi:dienelactone hydrolase
MRSLILAIALFCGAGSATAEVKTKKVEYKYDGVTFIGHLFWDDAVKGQRPGVLVVHEWWGLDAYAKSRAEQLAKLGYVAFACDMYGNGEVTEHPMDATKMATAVRKNVDVWRGRAVESLKQLTASEYCDPKNVAAIGYCFGGTTALQLAATGAELKAVVTFHSALPTLKPEEAKAIKARVLVCHGADDKFIKPESIDAFKKTMEDGHVSFVFESYPGAVHSFTVPDADARKIDGMAFNKAADEKSWNEMKKMFGEVFKK